MLRIIGKQSGESGRLLKAVTRGGVFWVFEPPRNFRDKIDTQKQIFY